MMALVSNAPVCAGARCKVLRCVEWGGPKRTPRQYRQPGTPYNQVADQRVQGNATLTAGSHNAITSAMALAD